MKGSGGGAGGAAVGHVDQHQRHFHAAEFAASQVGLIAAVVTLAVQLDNVALPQLAQRRLAQQLVVMLTRERNM